jgi:hypothetical protein
MTATARRRNTAVTRQRHHLADSAEGACPALQSIHGELAIKTTGKHGVFRKQSERVDIMGVEAAGG